MFNSKWYNSLLKPPLTPPAAIFKPVWAILYIFIIISFVFYLLQHSDISKFKGYIFFTVQMILNILWTPLFFYFKNMLLALICVILMNIFIIFTIREFYKISKPAGYILIPYLIWTLFAAYLNFGYVWLNR